MNEDRSYISAGFSRFFRRSIDNPTTPANSLHEYASNANQQSRTINFDQQPVSGSVGDIFTVGKIKIDGGAGRMSIFDEAGNEVGRIGAL